MEGVIPRFTANLLAAEAQHQKCPGRASVGKNALNPPWCAAGGSVWPAGELTTPRGPALGELPPPSHSCYLLGMLSGVHPEDRGESPYLFRERGKPMIPKDTQGPLFHLQGLHSGERWTKLGEEHTQLQVPLAVDEGEGKSSPGLTTRLRPNDRTTDWILSPLRLSTRDG